VRIEDYGLIGDMQTCALVGLLSEEYDVKRKRQVGNFPQAFSHLTLIMAAKAISEAEAKSKPRPAAAATPAPA
jgi:Glycosyl hydrolases family 15